MKQLVLIVLFFTTTFLVFSQEESKKSGLGFYVYGGVQIPELKNIDAFLSTNGYPLFDNEHFSAGFALYKETDKIVNTVEIFAYNKSRTSLGNFSSLSVLSGSLSIGYKLFSDSEKYDLIPSIALNVYQASLRTSAAPTTQIAYPTYLSNGSQEEISGLGIGTSANITALFYPFKNWKSFHFGFKAGYNYTASLEWQTINNYNVTDVPETELLGANISLLIGLKF